MGERGLFMPIKTKNNVFYYYLMTTGTTGDNFIFHVVVPYYQKKPKPAAFPATGPGIQR